MESIYLSRGERFLIDTMTEFDFLNSHSYDLMDFCTMGWEYYATYIHRFAPRSVSIQFKYRSGLDVIFQKETSEGIESQKFSKLTKMKEYPTSIRELAEIIQTYYMYLIIPYK